MDYLFELSGYRQAVAEAKNVADLRKAAEMLEDCGKLALKAIEKLTDADMPEFHQGRELAKKDFPGTDWMHKYGNIIMPPETIEIALLCHEFGLPFGAAYIQWKRVRDPNYIPEL